MVRCAPALLLLACAGPAEPDPVPVERGVCPDGSLALWYVDADRDTYGDPELVRWHCGDPGPGWSARAEDCDDADPEQNPGMTEVCNRKDDDCD